MTVQPTSTAKAPTSRMSAFEIEKAAHLLRLRLQMASLKTSSTHSSSSSLEEPAAAASATVMETDAASPTVDVKPLPGQLIGLGLPGLENASSSSVMSWDEEQQQQQGHLSERILAEQTAPAQVRSPQLAQVAPSASTSKTPKPTSHRRTPSASRAPEPSLYEAIFGASVDLKPAGPSAAYKHRRTPSVARSTAAEASSAPSSSSKASHSSPHSLSGMSVRLHIAASSPQLGSPRRTGGSGQFPPRHDPHNHPSWETQEREQRLALEARASSHHAASDNKSGEASDSSHDAFALPTVSPSKRKHESGVVGAVGTPPRRTPHGYQLGSDIVLPLGAGMSPRRSIHSPRQRTVSQGVDHGLLPNGHPASSLAQDLGLTTGSFRARMPSTPRRLGRMSSNKGGEEPVGREHTQAETDRVASLLAAMADERSAPPSGASAFNRLKGPSPLSARGVGTPNKVDPSTPTKAHHRVGSSASHTPVHRGVEETDESAALSLLFFAHSPSSASSSRFPGTTPSLLNRSARTSSSRTSTPDAKMWRPSAPARTLFSDDDASTGSASRSQRDGSLSSTSSVDSSSAAHNVSGSNTESGSESQVSALTVLQESPDLDAMTPESQKAKMQTIGGPSGGAMGAGGIFTPPPSTKKAAGSAAERTAHFERLAARGGAGHDSPPMTPPRGTRDREMSTASMSHARRDSRGEFVLGTPPPRSPSLQPPETPKAMGRFDYSAWVNVSPSPKMTRSRAPSGQFAPFDTPRMREPSSNGWIDSLWGMAGPGPSPQLDRATKAAQALSDVIHTPSRVKRQRVSTPDADIF